MILQRSIPYDPLTPMPLPGISPLNEAEWIVVDDAYGGQMEERARLIREARDTVIAMDESGDSGDSKVAGETVALKPAGRERLRRLFRCDTGLFVLRHVQADVGGAHRR